MNVYLVGGAVRDMLMGISPKDIDFVVVGSTPEQMIANGFSKVGADFPVYLQPSTGNQYALARRDKKTGVGYHGFTSEFDIDVTLENGENVKTINPELLQKFIDAGFDLKTEYNTETLIEFFRNINKRENT